jgi:hypothetical protein
VSERGITSVQLLGDTSPHAATASHDCFTAATTASTLGAGPTFPVPPVAPGPPPVPLLPPVPPWGLVALVPSKVPLPAGPVHVPRKLAPPGSN